MIRKILKTLCILSVIFIIPVSAQNNNVIDEVIWIVGDEPILKSEVEEERLRMQYEGESIVGDPYCFIPEQIALQKLFLHQAKLDSIEVQEQAVFQRVDEMINIYISRIGSKEKMEEYLRKNSAEIRDELLTRVRDNAIEEQMKYHLTQNVKSTPSEVRKFYNSLPQDSIPFIPTQVEVQILTFKPEIAQSEIDNVKSKLRDFTDRINKGDASFSTLAILYSEDPGSARLGGELGLKTKGEFVPEFSAVGFQLNDSKKVSRIVETEFGYHIIQLIEKRGDRSNLRHILLKPKVSEIELKETLTRMDSLKMDIDSAKFTYEEAVLYLSNDKDTRNNNGLMVNRMDGSSKFKMEELPSEVARIADKLEVGDISAPFIMINEKTGREDVAIIKLKNRIPGHKATVYDDFQELKDMLENQKREEILKEFIKKKQQETYIRIKEGWANCEFQYPGWIKN